MSVFFVWAEEEEEEEERKACSVFTSAGFIFLCIFVNLHVSVLLFSAAVCVLQIKVQRCS